MRRRCALRPRHRRSLHDRSSRRCFLGAGLFLWLTCFGAARRAAPAHDAAGAFALLLTSIHMTLLGALLALSPRPLYGAGDVTCFGSCSAPDRTSTRRRHHAADRRSRLPRRRPRSCSPGSLAGKAAEVGRLMHVNWKHLAIGLAILPVAVLFATWIGFFNVGASTGHWKVTEWFLHFAMRSAVRTYALDRRGARRAAALRDPAGRRPFRARLRHLPWRARRTALACRASDAAPAAGPRRQGRRMDGCRSSSASSSTACASPACRPGRRSSATMRSGRWSPSCASCPTMDAARWRDLAYGKSEPPTGQATSLERALADCARCHGEDGLGRSPATPVLAGQRETYLLESLKAYACRPPPERRHGNSRHRQSILHSSPISRGIFPSCLRPQRRRNRAPALIARGEEIARRGMPERDVPACLGCHGRPDRNPIYPELSGQPAEYIATQLELFRARKARRHALRPSDAQCRKKPLGRRYCRTGRLFRANAACRRNRNALIALRSVS